MDRAWEPLRQQLASDLLRAGFELVETKEIVDSRGEHGEVSFFKGHGRLLAIPYSVVEGITCFVGPQGGVLDKYEEWPTLWHLLNMDNFDLSDLAQGDAFFAQFPDSHADFDVWAEFIITKLRQLIERPLSTQS